MPEILKVENLNFNFSNKPLLKNVSFDVKAGEFFCVVGTNGAGKSTLARILVGLDVAKSGEIVFNFENTALVLNEENLAKIRQNLGLVFQNPENQFVAQTVFKELAFNLENKCVSRSEIEKQVKKIAKDFGLDTLLSEIPTALSGGQMQKLAVASSLISGAKILIFDESLSMLDSATKLKTLKLIKDLNQKQKITVILITHDPEVLINSDRVLKIDNQTAEIQSTSDYILGLPNELLPLTLQFYKNEKNQEIKRYIWQQLREI